MDGIENCSCSVVLSWMHGPKAGTLTLARVEDLCLIRSQKQLDPRLACFSELVKWKHGITLPKLITEDINQASCSYCCLSSLPKNLNGTFFCCRIEEILCFLSIFRRYQKVKNRWEKRCHMMEV